MKPLCIYHGNCADGFAAAWAVRRKFYENVDFFAGFYKKPPPDVAGRDVIIVDFSYKRPVLDNMAQSARSILVLDHHKSAQEDLSKLATAPLSWDIWMKEVETPAEPYADRARGLCPMAAMFDMNRSGAMIVWNYFHTMPPPTILCHVQDRDLWRFHLPKTREIQANIFSYPYEFGLWDWFMSLDHGSTELDRFIEDGTAIERKHFKDIEELLKLTVIPLKIGGYTVPAANLPYTMGSDAGHRLCEEAGWNEHGGPAEFGATYWIGPKGATFSLRSVGDFDVQAIAVQYGGGGHKNAAGFEVTLDEFVAMQVA